MQVRREVDGSLSILTAGDVAATVDPEPVATDLPVSRMAYRLPYAWYIVALSRTGTGKAALVALPVILLALSVSRRSGRRWS